MQTGLKQILVLSLLLLGLPLLGVVLNDMPITPYLELPPRTRHVQHAAFSWPIFMLTIVVGALLLVGIIGLLMHARKSRHLSQIKTSHHWPWWGWLGLMVLAVSWILAWNRFPWFAPWQWATFTPLLVLLGLQGLSGEPDLIKEIRARGWQVIALPALAALQCGFFWEMWNYYSAAKWIYSVPLVDNFQIFEMPVVGFTGYLPFGIECLVIALLLWRRY